MRAALDEVELPLTESVAHASAEPAAVQVRDLVVMAGLGRKRRTLLREVSFDVKPGQFVTIIGTSGCGKSTLIKALAGLVVPYSGDILFSGHPVPDLREDFPLAVGYLPQFGAFHPLLTVRENLMNAAALRLPMSVGKGIREGWLNHIVTLSGLGSLLDQRYSTLSGGQMRRMALAEQLVGDPQFLLLDELTSGLDEYSDRELMLWLRELAHHHKKTVLLVTHATYHLDLCDTVLFLDRGRLITAAPYREMLARRGVSTVADLFEQTRKDGEIIPDPTPVGAPSDLASPQPLRTQRPPSGLIQSPVLLLRQARLFVRDWGQMLLHLILIVTFPAMVALFALKGLPEVRQISLGLEKNVVKTLADQLTYLRESFSVSGLVSGLAMFQVILLTLIGANNGAREIAREREILGKELRAGLSPFAYLGVKASQIAFLCAVQSFWMAWFVKTICGFPGSLAQQFGILFATTAAMSATCLAISAACSSPERASLLSIYLVGFQLPLSGAALALPEWLSWICRPFIAAYWGWSGYLRTLDSTPHYDVIAQSTTTQIASLEASHLALGLHVVVSLIVGGWSLSQKQRN